MCFKAVFQDTIATTKYKVATTLFDLISHNQFEQPRLINEMLVNKLGDPDYQVASRIVYNIKNYCNFFFILAFCVFFLVIWLLFEVNKCPKMKMDLLTEVERLVSRQNINQRAQWVSFYYIYCLSYWISNRKLIVLSKDFIKLIPMQVDFNEFIKID